jgi:LL-diaminopimelate aminotransferase
MNLQAADRVREIPPYLFAQIDKLKAEARERGADLIDFGIGDPDIPTPAHIVEALCRAAAQPANHRYPAYAGSLRCRQAASDFYRRRFGLDLNPTSEVLTLIGSKEGLAHVPLALINPGDLALVPDLAYPVYATTTRFAGGEVHRYRLRPEAQFLPDLDGIPVNVAERAKLIYINYPNNPTGGVATLEDYARILEYARRHDLIVISDLAYSDMYFEEPRPPSFLQVEGARERCLEFYSLSKTYNMTGWRVGFALGHPTLVAALAKIKTNMDSGVFGAVQEAAITALSGEQCSIDEMRGIYRERRDLLCAALRRMGLSFTLPKATFYVFVRIPSGTTSMAFTTRLLQEVGVVVTPGTGFGEQGEGFVRFALSVDSGRIREAGERLSGMKL